MTLNKIPLVWTVITRKHRRTIDAKTGCSIILMPRLDEVAEEFRMPKRRCDGERGSVTQRNINGDICRDQGTLTIIAKYC